jgi:hypothetical protein
VPLDLAVERPAGGFQRLVPGGAERPPVAIAKRDAAEREEAGLVDLAALVQKEQVHRATL